jgi:hypothetical protein
MALTATTDSSFLAAPTCAQTEARRDRTLFDLAISKLRGCDLVKMKIGSLVSAQKYGPDQW